MDISTDQSSSPSCPLRDDFSDYVAHLQLHMALQARHLVPSMERPEDSLKQLIYETQATSEKLASRQSI